MIVAHAIGRVGQDAEIKYTQGGKAVCSFSMAIDQGKDKDGEKKSPQWIKATLWEKRAESLAPYITKGKLVYVQGPVSTEAWIGKQDGDAQSKLVITVREFEFCGGNKQQENGGDHEAEMDARGYNNSAPPAQPSSNQITDDDIPF